MTNAEGNATTDLQPTQDKPRGPKIRGNQKPPTSIFYHESSRTKKQINEVIEKIRAEMICQVKRGYFLLFPFSFPFYFLPT